MDEASPVPDRTPSWHHLPPLEQLGREGGESDETSRTFCGHDNFPEMNGWISVYGGDKVE